VPAGVGAAVQTALQKFTPGMEATPMPGLGGRRDPNDPPSVASYLRTLIALPQILLDPKMQRFSWPELSRAMDDPITYGEFFNIASAFAAGPPVVRGVGAIASRGMRGRVPAPGATALATIPKPEPQVIRGQRVPGAVERPQAGPMAQPPSEAVPIGALGDAPRLALPPAAFENAGMPMTSSSLGPRGALSPAETVRRFTQMAPDAEVAALASRTKAPTKRLFLSEDFCRERMDASTLTETDTPKEPACR
ncbi:MAG: hypothetical protein ACREE7_02350, partial [Dongiaceae bacterium]